jgi:uncharacterized protein
MKKTINKTICIAFALFLGMNIIAFFHAYKFTHYSNDKTAKTKQSNLVSPLAKVETLLSGIENPRPANNRTPSQSYETICLHSNKNIVCWWVKKDSAKGTVVLFHGYGGHKASLLEESDEFIKLGYNTMLVDFMGSGDSQGNQTTIGYIEAAEVETCFEFIKHFGLINTS